MKKLFAIVALLATALGASGAQIWTVNSVADPADPIPLVWLNASTINSNVFAAYGTAWGDGYGGMWTFKRADASVTNTLANGGPVESANPLSPAGRWIKTLSAAQIGGTNVFNTILVTNLYITTNVYVINGGATNQEGLWIETNSFLQPVHLDLPIFITNHVTLGPGTTNVLKRDSSDLVYTNSNTLVAFQVVNGAGNRATFEVDGGGHPEVLAESGHLVYLSVSGSHSVYWTGSIFAPTAGPSQLGNAGYEWDKLYLSNHVASATNYIYFGTNTLSVTGSDIYWNQTKLN